VVTANAWNGRKVLITGATGFLGRHVSGVLVQEKLDVCVCAHDAEARNDSRFYRLDLCNRDSVFRLFDNMRPEAVVHLAATGVTRSDMPLSQLLEVNVIGTENLLAAMAEFACDAPIVLAGTAYEYRAQSRPLREEDALLPTSAYAVSKSAAGLCALFYGQELPITLLRLFNTYGPGEPPERLLPYMVSCAREGRSIDLTGCEQVRDFTYVTDIARAFWLALKSPPAARRLRCLNVGSGRSMVLKQFVNIAVQVLRENGFFPKVMFGARPYRPDDPMYCVADTTRVSEELGFRTVVDLEDGIRRTVLALLSDPKALIKGHMTG
jgi:nucleoside-diphosphate-sugar epimerase